VICNGPRPEATHMKSLRALAKKDKAPPPLPTKANDAP